MQELTDRQRTALWLRAQGLTAEAIGRRLTPPCKAAGAQDLLHKTMKAFDAADSANAVFRAMASGVIGPYQDCGTRKAYERHLRRVEVTCVACRIGNTERVTGQRVRAGAHSDVEPHPAAGSNRGWKNVRPREKLPLTITHRRILTTFDAGASTSAEVGRALGVTDGHVRRMLADIYDRLGIDTELHGPAGSREQAVKIARERGLIDGSPVPYPEISLTDLQCRILVTAQGDESLSVIGKKFGMSRSMAASHLSRIYLKLGVQRQGRHADRQRNRRKEAFDIALAHNLL